MPSYVAVLALDGFDELKQQSGYISAVATLDAIGSAVTTVLPDARHARANRKTVEFTFRCASADIAFAELLKLRHELQQARLIPLDVVIAAVPYDDDCIIEASILMAERLLNTAVRDRAPVLVAEQGVSAPNDHRLTRDLRQAMEDGSLVLHYQPKLRSRSSELAGAEALLRWTHPELGPLSPDLFIPAIERSDTIGALTDWVIDRAMADQERLRSEGVILPLHVNISGPLIADPAFAGRALERLGSAAGSIGFEITESAMIADPEGALVNLERLAAAGVRLAIDDYGTGFSSLAYLQRLPVHELKIDRRFVSALSTSARDPLLVRSTIDLAHALEMEVTAEGVETAAVLALLQVMRCDLVQGYFLSPPLPLNDLAKFARDIVGSAAARPQVASLRERLAERRAERGNVA